MDSQLSWIKSSHHFASDAWAEHVVLVRNRFVPHACPKLAFFHRCFASWTCLFKIAQILHGLLMKLLLLLFVIRLFHAARKRGASALQHALEPPVRTSWLYKRASLTVSKLQIIGLCCYERTLQQLVIGLGRLVKVVWVKALSPGFTIRTCLSYADELRFLSYCWTLILLLERRECSLWQDATSDHL